MGTSEDQVPAAISTSNASGSGSKSSKSKFMKESPLLQGEGGSRDELNNDSKSGKVFPNNNSKSGKVFLQSDAKAEKYKSSKGSKRLFQETHKGRTSSVHSADSS